MDILKKKEEMSPGTEITKAKGGRKKQAPKPPQDVYFFCNACGDKFKIGRDDAKFCSDICRSAANTVIKKVVQVPHGITEEEAKRYDEIVIKLKEDSGIIRRTLFKNDGQGIFTEVKKELHRSGDLEKDSEMERKAEEAEELAAAASKGAKVEPAPKNDKNLIPGEPGKEQRKLDKKIKKEKKKKN